MTKLKRLLIALSVMALMLTVIILPKAYAYDGNGTEADYSSPTGTWVDGVSYVKTGYLIYMTTDVGTVYKDPVFITTYSNTAYLPDLSWSPDNTATLMSTYVGNASHDPRGDLVADVYNRCAVGIDWSCSPFDSSGRGAGSYIRDWLISPQNGYDAGVIYMIEKYWGIEVRDKFIEMAATDHPYYFHVEPVAWHGAYHFDEYLGYQWLGTCRSLARHAFDGMYSAGQEPEAFGGGYGFKAYDWGNIPKSMFWEESWLGKTAPSYSDYAGKKYVSWNRLMVDAYGIVSIRPSDIGAGKQIIQSFYDETGTLIETTSGSSSTTVDMTEEGFTVTNWIVTEEVLEEPDSDDEYSNIISGVPTTRTGTEDETIELTEEESTVVIKYTQDNTPYRIVKVYEKNGTHKKTVTTGYSNTSYTVQTSSVYQGDSYGCKSWFTSKKLPTPSPSSTKAWNSILSSYKEAYSFIV